jgi:hypothetical protein
MLGAIGSIVALVCGIFVLVKLFQKEGVWKGILGLICLLYTYIWGWMHINDESLKIRTWMYVWTAAIVLGIVLNVIAQTQRGG